MDAMENQGLVIARHSRGFNAPFERAFHGRESTADDHGVERYGTIGGSLGTDLQADGCSVDTGSGAIELIGILFANQAGTV